MELYKIFMMYLGGINVIAFLLFGADKSFALSGRRRVKDKTLLLLALLGGSVGAYIGKVHFYHKTIKYRYILEAIMVIQAAAIAYVVVKF